MRAKVLSAGFFIYYLFFISAPRDNLIYFHLTLFFLFFLFIQGGAPRRKVEEAS